MSRDTILWTVLPFYICLIVALDATASANDDQSKTTTPRTSICEILANPAAFDGKVVSIQATVISGFEVFAISSPKGDCGQMWLAYNGGGPVASASFAAFSPQPRAPVTVVEDENFKRFQSFLDAYMYPRTREDQCMACHRYEVSAKMTGRVDYAGNQAGYGHMNAYKLQFELFSVSDVTAKDISSQYDPKRFSAEPVRLPTGYIEGRLISPDGKSYQGIWIHAFSAKGENEFLSSAEARTDNSGRFKISVPPGEYVVGVNVGMPASEDFPFRATFAPKAPSFESAQVDKVADGEHVSADIYLDPPLAPRSIAVVVQWPDGRPVQKANVWITEAAGHSHVIDIKPLLSG
jgi:hypothetical protein